MENTTIPGDEPLRGEWCGPFLGIVTRGERVEEASNFDSLLD